MITHTWTQRVFSPEVNAPDTRATPAPRARSRALAAMALLLLATLPAWGQPEPGRRKPRQPKPQPAQTTPSKPGSMAEEGRALFGVNGASGASAAQPDAWRIVLATAQGSDAKAVAEQALWKVQNVGQLPDAYLIQRSEDTWLVCFGRYKDPTDPAAQADLRRIHEIRVGADAPYAAAVLMPPLDGTDPVTSPYDLRIAKATYGAENALYTLAIGFYTRADQGKPSDKELAECRKLAEEAVAKLRREGDQAFFYHGPNGSQVTIGVFGRIDHDPVERPGYESPALKAARAKYPHYLLNGMGQRRTVKTASGKQKQLIPSSLVEIPD